MIHLAFKRQTGGIFDKLICWKTGSEFCHVELWLDGNIQAALCFSSRQPDGTSFAHINLAATFDGKPIYELIPLYLTSKQEIAVNAFCQGCGHKDYDWLGILGFVLPWGEHDDHDRFCSEICTESLEKPLKWWPGVKPWETSPGDLYRLAIKL
jgi:hypothetical protein